MNVNILKYAELSNPEKDDLHTKAIVLEALFTEESMADAILAALQGVWMTFHFVAIEDLLDCIGVDTTYVDSRWGWKILDKVTITQDDEHWKLEFPPAEKLDG